MIAALRRAAAVAAGLAAAAAALPANAHDTWFERLPSPPGVLLLALGTGDPFPRQESGIDAKHLVHRGCIDAAGNSSTLQPLRDDPAALVLSGPPGAVACWVQLAPFDLVLAPDKVGPYLREVGAGPELRAAWADRQARGLPWKERYAKHARIELGDPAGALPRPAPLPLDAVLDVAAPVRTGAPFGVRLLRDGAPLARQPVELRGELSRYGIWRRTDATGRANFTVPLPGRWIVRAIDLRPDAIDADAWDSRFVTLAFDAVAAQAGSSSSPKARSANQAAASAAIASEPPTSTARR